VLIRASNCLQKISKRLFCLQLFTLASQSFQLFQKVSRNKRGLVIVELGQQMGCSETVTFDKKASGITGAKLLA